MMLADATEGYMLVLLPLIYGGFGIGSIVVLNWTIVVRRWSVPLLIFATLSVVFGAVLLTLILMNGVSLPQQWLDILVPIVPFVCGSIAVIRLLYFRYAHKEV